jgi:hypothetical protein
MLRLKVQLSDGNWVNSKKLVNESQVEYSLVVDRFFSKAQILNSSGVTVAQLAGNGNSNSTMQAIKNYMIASLSFKFPMDNNIKYDNTGLALAVPLVNVLTYSAVPTVGVITLRYNSVSATSSIPYNATAAEVQAALRTISGLEYVTVTGSVGATFSVTNGGVITPLTYSTTGGTLKREGQSKVAFDAVPDAGAFKLTYGGNESASLAFNASAAQVQTALRALTGLSAVTVSGNFTSGFTTLFVGMASPTAITVTTNTLTTAGGALTPVVTNVTIPVAYAAVTIAVS